MRKQKKQQILKRVFLCLLMLCVFFTSSAMAAETNDPLKPADTHSEDELITLHKQAERTGPTEWEVEVSANVGVLTVEEPELEVVFVLDTSSSMLGCPYEVLHMEDGGWHEHDDSICPFGKTCKISFLYRMLHSSREACTYKTADGTVHVFEPNRYTVAVRAINELIGTLPADAYIKRVVFNTNLGSYYTKVVEAYTEDYPEEDFLNATYIMHGVDLGIDQFTADASTKKILVIVTDGVASDDSYSSDKLTAFSANGGTVFTVGFNHEDPNLEGMVANGGEYFRAHNPGELTAAFEKIGVEITAMVIDPMGTSVNFEMDSLNAKTGNLTTSGNTIAWTPDEDNEEDKEEGLTGEVVNYTYTVSLNTNAKNDVGTYAGVPLNNPTLFRYGIKQSGNKVTEMYELNFPIPQATYAYSSMQVNWQCGNEVLQSTEPEKIISDWGTPAYETNYQSYDQTMTVDGTEYRYSHTTVTKNQNTTITMAEIDPSEAVAYVVTHHYKEVVPGQLEITATKRLSGRTFVADDSFMQFEIKREGKAPMPGGENGANVVINLEPNIGFNEAPINFGVIAFEEAGTYEYTISERPNSENKHRVEHDPTVYTLKVTVDENRNVSYQLLAGTVEVNEIVFQNVYPTVGELIIEKTVKDPIRDSVGPFTFYITTENDTYRSDMKTWAEKNQYTFDDAKKALVVTSPAFTLADGEQTQQIKLENFPTGDYTVTEVEQSDYTVSYQVNGGETNNVTVPRKDTVTAKVTNTRKTGSLKITKQFTGIEQLPSDLTFYITRPDGSKQTITYADFSNGSYLLENIPCGSYKVDEAITSATVPNYDLTIKVGDVETWLATVTVQQDQVAEAAFTNVYTRKTGALTISKTVKNGDENKAFTFTVAPVANGGVSEAEWNDYLSNKDSLEVTLKHGESKTLSNLPTGKYLVTETPEAGYTSAPESMEVEVTVYGAEAKFVNTYAAAGSITFAGTKKLEGRDLTANDEFTFEIKEGETVVGTAKNDANGKINYPVITYKEAGTHNYTVRETSENGNGITVDTRTYTVTVEVTDDGMGNLTAVGSANANALDFTNSYTTGTTSVTFAGTKKLEGRDLTANDEFTFEIKEGETVVGTANNDATGKINYPVITYEKAGAHTYTVRETSENGNGITVDGKTYTVTVEVTDDGKGNLVAVASDNANALDFINSYTTGPASVTFAGNKKLEGRALTANDVFTFEIKEGETVVGTATNDATGKINYPVITYKEAGTHNYTVRETSENSNGIITDGTVYNVTVDVIDDGMGKLIIGSSANITELNFTNSYTTGPASVTFAGTKTLEGREMTDDDVFTFEIIEGETVVGTAYNDSTGKIDYPEITYNRKDVGTHTYTVRETSENGKGITVDGKTYTVTVDVTDDGMGNLTAEPSDNADALNFNNTYTTETISVTFEGKKIIEGRNLTADDVFNFEITDGETVWTVQNYSTGKIDYPTITYTLEDVGEHTYTVRETSESGSGITVDNATYTVTVEIADNGDGTLSAETSANADELNFVNTYAASGELYLGGLKYVNGTEPASGESFTFVLMDETGAVLQTVTNTKSLITFEPLCYTLADVGKTFLYTVKETTQSDDLYETDDRVYTITVTVADKGDGKLEITKQVSCDNETVDTIEFDNVALGGLKISNTVVGGPDDAVFDYKVTFVDANGNELKGTFPAVGVAGVTSGDVLQLKHGETVVVQRLPEGTVFVIEQSEAYAYSTTANGADSLKVEGSIQRTQALADFVNIYRTTDFVITKEWQGVEGGMILLTLYADGEMIVPQPECFREGDVYSYKNLPQYSEAGSEIVYSAMENYMEGFMTTYLNIAPYQQETDRIYNGGTIVNRAVTEFRVRKVWKGLGDGEKKPTITLTLYADGEPVNKSTPVPDANGWYVYTNLPVAVNGKPIVYSVVETPMAGYDTVYGDSREAKCAYHGQTITNHKIPVTGDKNLVGLYLLGVVMAVAGGVLMLKKTKKA